MARYREPVCKLCRAQGEKLFLKGDRCLSAKCSMTKRPFAPGQHGQAKKKLSEYGLHLKEKQKARNTYLILEKQFSRYFQHAERKNGVTGTILLQLLETRLDSVVYQSGLTAGRKQARQFIRHKHFLVNGKTVDIPSYRLKVGDIVSVKEKSEKLIREISENFAAPVTPRWLTVDKSKLTIKLELLPEREDLNPNIKEQLIIEYYSK